MSIVLNGLTGITAPDIDVTAQTTVADFDAGITLGGSATTLDGYEEGTYTVGFAYDSGVTVTSQNGYYTKIGDVVHAYGQITWSAKNSDSSAVHISLPFTAFSSYGHGTFDIRLSSGISRSTYPNAAVSGISGGPYFQIYESSSNALTYTELNSSGSIYFAYTYYV